MPLSFMSMPTSVDTIVLNPAERRFLSYVNSLEKEVNNDERFSVTVNIQISFIKSKVKDALNVAVDPTDPKATKIQLTEEDMRARYPWDYERLTAECRKRYTDFKLVQKYHQLRTKFLASPKFGHTRHLDPSNPKSSKINLYNPNIITEFDKCYKKK
jgi:hypothetical protein